jgi:hypothetical protein
LLFRVSSITDRRWAAGSAGATTSHQGSSRRQIAAEMPDRMPVLTASGAICHDAAINCDPVTV